MQEKQQKILFVCLGNICRSPTAHAVFRHLVQQENLLDKIYIDSAGTGDWHVGKAPDGRAMSAAKKRGYNMEDLVARQVAHNDFQEFDFILAMDQDNLYNLQRIQKSQPSQYLGHLGLFLEFADNARTKEVPDPYYGGDNGFEQVLDLVEAASRGLLNHLQRKMAE